MEDTQELRTRLPSGRKRDAGLTVDVTGAAGVYPSIHNPRLHFHNQSVKRILAAVPFVIVPNQTYTRPAN